MTLPLRCSPVARCSRREAPTSVRGGCLAPSCITPLLEAGPGPAARPPAALARAPPCCRTTRCSSRVAHRSPDTPPSYTIPQQAVGPPPATCPTTTRTQTLRCSRTVRCSSWVATPTASLNYTTPLQASLPPSPGAG